MQRTGSPKLSQQSFARMPILGVVGVAIGYARGVTKTLGVGVTGVDLGVAGPFVGVLVARGGGSKTVGVENGVAVDGRGGAAGGGGGAEHAL